MHDPAVRALAAKVRYVVDPDNPYPRQFTGHVRVTLRNGEVREASQDHFRGGRDEPMSADGARGEVHRQLRVRRLGRGSARATRSRCCAACAAAPRVDLAALRG